MLPGLHRWLCYAWLTHPGLSQAEPLLALYLVMPGISHEHRAGM